VNDSLVLPDISAIRFAAFDMDGTLLGPDHNMHPDNIAALHNLRDNGIHVLLASGRNHDNISSWYRRLDLTGPIVSGNGALVKDFATGNIIQEAIVEPATALDVLALGRQIGITQVVDHTDGRAVVEHQSYWGDIVGERCGASLGIVENIDDLCAAGPRKLLWVDDGETIAYWESELRRLLAGKAHICVSGAEYLEILPFATHKGTGVLAAADFLGFSAQETLSAGDSDNDAEMLAWARYGLAMPHATQKAKAAAWHTLPSGLPETLIARFVESLFG
jgi:Cof subfamily protein (haloacid dehalogenase superfamily)